MLAHVYILTVKEVLFMSIQEQNGLPINKCIFISKPGFVPF